MLSLILQAVLVVSQWVAALPQTDAFPPPICQGRVCK